MGVLIGVLIGVLMRVLIHCDMSCAYCLRAVKYMNYVESTLNYVLIAPFASRLFYLWYR